VVVNNRRYEVNLTDLLKNLELGKVYTDSNRPPFKVNEASDKIQVQGVGVYDYKTLSKKVVKMLKDLEKRANKEDFGSVGKSQLNTLTAMWIALKQYEEKQ